MEFMFTSSDALETRAIMEPHVEGLLGDGLRCEEIHKIDSPHQYTDLGLAEAKETQRRYNLPFLPATRVNLGSNLNQEYVRLKEEGILFHHQSDNVVVSSNYNLNREFLPSRSAYFVTR